MLKLYEKDIRGDPVGDSQRERLLLGEIQFSFVSFLIGQCFDALEQWKGLVNMLCNCEDAFEQRGALFAGFVGVLLGQLKELPTDFFTDEILEGSFLGPAVTSLVEIARECTMSEATEKQVRTLIRVMKERFNMEVDDPGRHGVPCVVTMPLPNGMTYSE